MDLAGAEGLVEYYRDSGPNPSWQPALFGPFEAFGMAGYLALLVGQQLPYRRTRATTDAERTAWKAQQEKWKSAAQRGMTVAESLAVIRSPKWRWGVPGGQWSR